MALSVQALIEQTREKYCLKLLTGEIALDFMVTWVHMMEDTSAADFFWGNEMVVTSGYTAQDEASLLQFIDTLTNKHCAGIVINIGQYIHTIPQAVIDHCRQRKIPLLTMPWEMSITEFVRHCCTLITRSTLQEEDLADELMHIIRSPQDAHHSIGLLSESFSPEAGFRFLAIWVKQADTHERVSNHRITLRLHTSMRKYDFPYLVFRQERRFFLFLNHAGEGIAQELAQRILSKIQESFPALPVQIGIGESVMDFSDLSGSFHGAVSAQRCASLQHLSIVAFRNMGFYKLLYSVPDDSLLMQYYHEKLDPLLQYDAQHGSAYTETLFRYLLSDGSLQEVASAMFTHRNTINYRMGKIREILGTALTTQQEKLPYLIAYHCGRILRLMEEYD